MISQDQLIPVGKILKPHGIDGEMVVYLERDIPEWSDLRCIVLMMDGIPVPFFISSSRSKSAETDLLRLDSVESDTEAKALAGHTVYLLRSDIGYDEPFDEEGFYADDLIGFSAYAADGRLLGKITALDTSTPNYLFIIKEEGTPDILVPAVGEFIASLDASQKTVVFDLPDGLLE